MVIGSPQATSGFGKVNHKEQQRYMFKDLRDILTLETSVSEDDRFAFGYNDCMYIGSCKQLRTDIFCPILAGFTYYAASAGTLLSIAKESKLPLNRPNDPLVVSKP